MEPAETIWKHLKLSNLKLPETTYYYYNEAMWNHPFKKTTNKPGVAPVRIWKSSVNIFDQVSLKNQLFFNLLEIC